MQTNLNSINQTLVVALVLLLIVAFIGILNKVTTQLKGKILASIVYFLSSLAIIGNILILKTSYDNWKGTMVIATADAILILSGIVLFSSGLLGFLFQNSGNKG